MIKLILLFNLLSFSVLLSANQLMYGKWEQHSGGSMPYVYFELMCDMSGLYASINKQGDLNISTFSKSNVSLDDGVVNIELGKRTKKRLLLLTYGIKESNNYDLTTGIVYFYKTTNGRSSINNLNFIHLERSSDSYGFVGSEEIKRKINSELKKLNNNRKCL